MKASSLESPGKLRKITFRSVRALGVLGVTALTLACDGGGGFPLSVEVKDGPQAGKKPDEIAVVVKTIPDTELQFQGERKSVGDKAGESFAVPKSKLKLGKNAFTVEAISGVLFSKKTASATANFDAPARVFLRFFPVGGEAQSILTCSNEMCGGTNFKVEKNGKLRIEVESSLAGTLNFAGKKEPVGPNKRAPFEVDLTSMLATLPIDQRDRLTLPMVLEAGGATSQDSLTLQGPALEATLVEQLARAEQGPVNFVGEPPAGPEPRGTALLNKVAGPPGQLLIVGKPATVGEIDLVAIATPAERFFACGGAATSASGILYRDLDIKVVDRRAGKVVQTRKLMADRVACPPTPTAGQIKADVREADIRRALAEMSKKPGLANAR